LQFALLWAGFLCGMLPLVVLACSTGINGLTRSCALAGIGLLGMGRVLRLPFGPLGNDEFIHMRQTIETYLNGEVGHGSGIFSHFPGLHQAISAFALLTGSPLWPAALAVIALAHVLSVLAVYQLVRAVGASPTGAAVGAVVYTLNPSWLYFDTSASYESLALPLLLWCLAAAVTASRAPTEPSLRYIAVVVLCAAALPMVHHLATIMLLLILALLIVAVFVHSFRRMGPKARDAPREHLWPLLLAASLLLVSAILWWSDILNDLVAYLSPSLTRGWAQVSEFADLSRAFGKVSGTRLPFAGAQTPIYETVSGLLFSPVVLLLFLVSLAVLWVNRRRFGSAPWGFAALGAMFFLSIPMALTSGGGEGAHRSWAYSFIGIAVVCGLGWSIGVSPAVVARLGRPEVVARLARPGVRIGVVGVVLIVMYVGGAALGTNISARFPGNMGVGDDARSVSREGAAVAAWLAAHAPVDSHVVADRYVSQQVAGWAGRMSTLAPSATFPLWDLYLRAEPVRRQVLQQVLDADVRYFVVDARMATTRPRMGYWFIGDEPGSGDTRLFPQVAIDRFNCLPWLRATYAAGPLTVYQVDASVLTDTMVGSCERRQP
jgi:cbb3-type cytochrome oxidase subunit 3